MPSNDYASPDEVAEWQKSHYSLTATGRLWADEIERRFAEGDSIDFIAHELGIKPWQIQLLIVQLAQEK